MGLNSTSVIKIVDLLCEGPIKGIVGGDGGVYINETPIEDSKGVDNFDSNSVNWDFRVGGRTQAKLTNYLDNGTAILNDVNAEVGANYSETVNASNEVSSRNYGEGFVTRSITDTDSDSFHCIFTIPALFSTAQEGLAKGQLFNARVRLIVYVRGQGQAYKGVYDRTITGVSTTEYQIKTPKIKLPGDGPWDIKVLKKTAKEADFEIKYTNFSDVSQKIPLAQNRGNRAIWTSLVEKKELRIAYPYTACAGLRLSTKAFNSLPTRAYLVEGLKVSIPANANVREDGSLNFIEGNEFTGELKEGQYTSCPVCAFYDMLTSTKHGAGDFLSKSDVNWIDLYPLAQYANQLVSTPDGGTEPRFSINTVIGVQADAYSVIQDLASVFRGMTYWASSAIQVVGDHGNLDGTDITPVHLYNNANVLEGTFTYSGTSLKTRSTSLKIRYNDPNFFYKSNYVIVEDYDLITKYGYQRKEIIAFGCTSKYQAQRMGRWLMAAEELDQEVISFTTGLEGVAVFPGQVFWVADLMRQGQRLAGRITSTSTNQVTADESITLPSGTGHTLTCIMPDGDVETKTISSVDGTTININGTFSAAPQVNSVWSIASSSVTQQKYRCLSINENGDGTYSIVGTQFNDSIYKTADTGSDLEFEDVTTFDDIPLKPTNLVVNYSIIRVNNKDANRITFSWSRGTNGPAISFNVRWQLGNGNFTEVSTNNTSWNIDSVPADLSLTMEVRGVGPEPNNKKSGWSTKVISTPKASTGDSVGGGDAETVSVVELPPNPEDVTIQASTAGDTVTLRWDITGNYGKNHSSLTAIIRHSGKTDGTGTWSDSTLLRELQAIGKSITLPLLEGEYMIKFEDEDGNKSASEVSALIDIPDSIPRFSHIVRREDQDTPPFQGQKEKVFYSSEYDALCLDGTDYWDDKAGDIDDWGDIDFLGTLNSSGTYTFNSIVDLGGVFGVLFKRKLITRGIYPADLIDSKTANIDRWSDFDGALPDATTADLYFRKSNDASADDDLLTEDDDYLLLEDGSKILYESNQTYGEWTPMESSRYVGRTFQFKVDLKSTDTDQTPLVDELGYTMQFERRTASDSMASGAASKTVTYTQAFFATPKIGITASNMASGDYYEISSETASGFTIHFKNSSGASQDRTFSYQANGYGAAES